MAGNQKLALLYMIRELMEKTDEEHTLNASEIIRLLAGYGCEADRRTIYSNVEILREFGVDVVKKEDEHVGYYIASREFELPELKLLVDAVQSSKFITEKKSAELIRKLTRLTNEQQAKQLNRQVFISNRMKTGNEKVYYNVDAVHEAIGQDVRIRFQYGQFEPSKKLVARRGGRRYEVSPWALTWDDENYYLIAHDAEDGRIRHFRVDKMLRVSLTDLPRSGREEFRNFDLAAFARKTFGMYGRPDARVTLRCRNELAGVIIDRFGKEVMLIPDGEGFFKVNILVAVSRQFYGWLTGIGTGLTVTAPEEIRKEYLAYLKEIAGGYEDDGTTE